MKSILKVVLLVGLSSLFLVGCGDSSTESAISGLNGYIQNKYSKSKLYNVKPINVKVEEKDKLGMSAYFFKYELEKTAKMDFCVEKRSMGRLDRISKPTNGKCQGYGNKLTKKGDIETVKNQSHIMSDSDIEKHTKS